MHRFWTGLGLFCAALLAGCRDQAPPPAPITVTPPGLPVRAQPPLPTTRLFLGATELTAEVATRPLEQQAGMMFRTNMAENAAMLFVFGYPHRASFWMMNTPLPLSAAYIDPEGVILEIHDLEPHNTNSITAASSQVQYVLEVNQGWFQRHNLKPGVVIRTERGSMRETFFSR